MRHEVLTLMFCIICGYACSEVLELQRAEGVFYGAGSVKFSKQHGVFSEAFDLMMKPTEGGVIHYTLDGNSPTLDSPVYTDPIQINTTTVIRAVEAVGGHFHHLQVQLLIFSQKQF